MAFLRVDVHRQMFTFVASIDNRYRSMKRTRSRNKSSDKGKIHFYKGRSPTAHELVIKDDRDQALFIDEVQQASTVHMRIVVTWIPSGGRQQFRKSMDMLDAKVKKRKEAKYANTQPEERMDLYEHVLKQDFEVYDSFNLDIPPNVCDVMFNLQGHELDYWSSRYVYQLEHVVRDALSRHGGRIDIIMDNPPLEIIDDVRILCNRLISEGNDIQWVTISPSRHIVELQAHDFIAGLDYDIRTGWVQQDPRINGMSKGKYTRYQNIVERMKSRFKN